MTDNQITQILTYLLIFMMFILLVLVVVFIYVKAKDSKRKKAEEIKTDDMIRRSASSKLKCSNKRI